LETASWTEADTTPNDSCGGNGRPGTPGRPAPARAGDARPTGMKTLKARFGDEPERLRRKGQERMSLRQEGPPRRSERRGGDETQESSGLGRDATLPLRMTDCRLTRTPEGELLDDLEQTDTAREQPGDEPGGVRRQGEALKGGTPGAAAV